ncbi:MAG: butyrate kinase, partial [Alkalispirochaeta sp.]
NLSHTAEELQGYPRLSDQLPVRKQAIMNALTEAGIKLSSLDAVVGRGGVLYPMPSGTYLVNEQMIGDLTVGVMGEHASNLGGIIARDIANQVGGIPAFIVDPVVVDELVDEARASGVPEISRTSIFHALNQKAVARRYAADTGRGYTDVAVVVCHMGGGITVGSHLHGRVVDVSNGLNGEGPFTPERSGAVPALDLLKMAFSGEYSHTDLIRKIKGGGGLVAYLGTNDAREITQRVAGGDTYAELIYRSMAWQISKEIGAASAALGQRPDAIILTGGLAHDDLLTGWITEKISWIGDVIRYPGEGEMLALAEGALRVLKGEESPRDYLGKATV